MSDIASSSAHPEIHKADLQDELPQHQHYNTQLRASKCVRTRLGNLGDVSRFVGARGALWWHREMRGHRWAVLGSTGPCSSGAFGKMGRAKQGQHAKHHPCASLRCRARMQKYTWPGSNWRPSACEADVIATRPQVPVQSGAGGLAAPAIELALRALAPQGGQAIPPNLLAQRGACVGAIAPFPVSRSCASLGHLRKSQ